VRHARAIAFGLAPSAGPHAAATVKPEWELPAH
jgi:hypothetical protein